MFENISKNTKALVAAAGLGGAFSEATINKADAAILTSVPAQYNNSIALANSFVQNVDALPAAVQRIDSSGINHSSAILIAPDLFITAGHVTPRDNSTTATLTQIILGTNYNTSTERYTVGSTQRYPGYIFGDNSTIDLGIGRLSSFVNGFNTPVTFSPFSFGQTLTVIEYGDYGDVNTGKLTSQGDRMAGRAKTSSATGNGYPSGTYYTTNFDGPGASDPLNVGLLTGASGSPWYDSSGNLAGMSVAATLDSFGGGSSYLLNLSDPTVQSWLQPQIQASWDRFNAVPEPSSLFVTATIGAACAGIALRAKRRLS